MNFHRTKRRSTLKWEISHKKQMKKSMSTSLGRSPRRIAMSELGGANGQPLYKLIKLEITKALSGGKVAPGEAMPTEKEFAAQFGVSVGTIRRAMDELVDEHVVVRQQGRGTFLREFSQDLMLNPFWRIVRPDGSREIPIVQTINFKTGPARAEVASALKIQSKSLVIHIVNLLLLGGRRIICDDVYLPESMFPGMTKEILVEREGTMFGLYQNLYGVSVISTLDRVTAKAATHETAKLLDVPLGMPLLEINRVAHTFDGRPVEWRRSLVLTEGYEYRNSIGSSEIV